jgi:aspartate/methionine/tyrosine aminotransferase
MRQQLLTRTRGILNSNLPVIREWMNSHGGTFSMIEPEAGAIAYMKYRLGIDSLELVDRLRIEKSVLVVAGEHFAMGKYLRIGFGSDPGHLRSGLDLISEFISEIG